MVAVVRCDGLKYATKNRIYGSNRCDGLMYEKKFRCHGLKHTKKLAAMI
jgi:hypothetical protein